MVGMLLRVMTIGSAPAWAQGGVHLSHWNAPDRGREVAELTADWPERGVSPMRSMGGRRDVAIAK